jgi:hypothetical protein
MGIAPKLAALLCLLVHDKYYMEFDAWASLLNCQYYSIYWFTTGTTWSLLNGHRSQTSSNARTTSFRLVLYFTNGASLPYFQYYSILLVHDRYYMEVY